MIEVKRLTKRFGPNLAVDNLDFSVQEGEILGFLGPNGAGKTTTMRVLTGYFPPSGGKASVGGFDVVDEPRKARAAVGYLPENVPIYQDMRVREYLSFVARAKGMPTSAIKQERERVMEAVGITDRAGQLIKQLSKGYRQRVGLAQAMVNDPPVLILDEPTIGLDPRQIVEIRSLIKSFAGKKTVVLSSHILPEVAATCSKVVIINQGKLVAQGPPDMLTGNAGFIRLSAMGPQEELEKLIQDVPGVIGAEFQEETGDGACVFRVETKGSADVAAGLARAVVRGGLGLTELSPLALSLEEVFVNLTTTEQTHGEAAA